MSILNATKLTKEEKAEAVRASNQNVVCVFVERTYYATVGDPITSQRKRTFGVKLYSRLANGKMHISTPRFFKTEAAALKAAAEIDAKN
jgi:hypothetical protein